ncbi:MAG: hypothetical protein JWN76_3073 [Chitinophagaceae bacterium]|nr:hypothetical protein [Chitinophagaceae bacterium]
MKFILSLFSLFVFQLSWSQDFLLSRKAFFNKDYETSISFARKLPLQGNEKAKNEYFIAQCQAYLKNPDSALYYMNLAASDGFRKVDFVNDSVFLPYRDFFISHPVIEKIKANRENFDKSIQYPEYAKQLKEMFDADQVLRRQMSEAIKKTGSTPPELGSIGMQQAKNDADNIEKLKAIIKEIGWPTPQQVGDLGASTAFLIAQHTDANPQLQSQWLTLLEKAVNEGKAEKSNLAYLTDRVLINSKKAQIYGTQLSFATGKPEIAPCIEPENIDDRRIAMNLPPLAWYKALMHVKD